MQRKTNNLIVKILVLFATGSLCSCNTSNQNYKNNSDTSSANNDNTGTTSSTKDEDCKIWIHYNAVAPTLDLHGSKEFWANSCSFNNFQLELPTVGYIVEGGDFSLTDYFTLLDSDDIRYIPPLRETEIQPTTIDIMVFQGTGGSDWIKEASKRFSEIHKETSFQIGRKGIQFKVVSKKGVDFLTEMKTSAYDLYNYETYPDIYRFSKQESVLDISDVVEPLVSKIEPDLLERLKGVDGKYYALPHYEWFPGISYDKDLFDEQMLYFADPNAAENEVKTYKCKYGTGKFISTNKVTKSVGPNGVRGDYDDGLPSSLQELCVLFDKMQKVGISPLLLCGGGHYYSWYLPIALWASLTGGDAMRDVYCNWSDTPVDVIKSWSTESAFFKGSGIQKPVTEKKTLKDDNGYEMYNTAARYYALAFCQMAYDNQWIDKDALFNPNTSTYQAQEWFVNGHNGTRYGALWDGSYWCHEAVSCFNNNPSSAERHVAFMPLPTQLEGQVEEGKGKKPTLLNVGSTLTFASTRVAKTGKEKAVKEFLKFIYSDEELAAFSESTGLTVPMDYEYNMSGLNNPYYNDLATLRADAEVIHCSSASERFKKNLSSFILSYSMKPSTFKLDSGSYTGGYLNAWKKDGTTAKDILQASNWTKDAWNGMA